MSNKLLEDCLQSRCPILRASVNSNAEPKYKGSKRPDVPNPVIVAVPVPCNTLPGLPVFALLLVSPPSSD